MRKRITFVARIKLDSGSYGFEKLITEDDKGRDIMPSAPKNATAYYLRFTDAGRRVVEPAGNDFVEAYNKFERKQAETYAAARGVAIPVVEEPKERRTLASAVSDWTEQLKAGVTRKRKDGSASSSTVGQYTNAVCQFLSFANGEQVMYLDELKDNSAIFEAFARWIPAHTERRAGGHVEGTVRNKLQFVTAFYVAQKLGRALPFLKEDWVKNPRDEEQMPEAFTAEELTALLAVATEDEKDLLLFFVHTGFRCQEVAHACYSDIKQNGETTINVSAKPQYGFRVKNRKPRPEGIALTPDLVSRLKARQARYPDAVLIFPNGKSAPQSNMQMLSNLRRVATRAGMPNAFPVASRQGCHKLRRTFATLCHNAGISLRIIQSMLGHASITTTQKYLAAAAVPSHKMESAFAGVGN